jgi:hypothetical protein
LEGGGDDSGGSEVVRDVARGGGGTVTRTRWWTTPHNRGYSLVELEDFSPSGVEEVGGDKVMRWRDGVGGAAWEQS